MARNEQLIIIYDGDDGETHVYATAYDSAEANLQRGRCIARHGFRTSPRVLQAKAHPPRGV